MYVNVSVLKETRPHERRVALVPSMTAKLVKLGAKLRMQKGAGEAIKLADTAFTDVTFTDDRDDLVERRRCRPRRAAAGAERCRRDEGGFDPDLLHLREQGACAREAPARKEDHVLCHGTDSAHHPSAVDGRAVESVRARGLLRSAARLHPSWAHPPEAHDCGGHDWAGQGPGDGARRGRSRGDRDGSSARRGRGRVRRAPRDAGAGAVPGSQVRGHGRGCAGQGGLRARADPRGEREGGGRADRSHPGVRPRHHDRRHPGQGLAEADQPASRSPG